MSDQRFFGVLLLLSISTLVIGFVLGWASHEENDD
jgi:hypothetical protein